MVTPTKKEIINPEHENYLNHFEQRNIKLAEACEELLKIFQEVASIVKEDNPSIAHAKIAEAAKYLSNAVTMFQEANEHHKSSFESTK